jgi:hypothetical protein
MSSNVKNGKEFSFKRSGSGKKNFPASLAGSTPPTSGNFPSPRCVAGRLPLSVSLLTKELQKIR